MPHFMIILILYINLLKLSWTVDPLTLNRFVDKILFDLGLTSLSTFFSHIATVSGCGRELNAHF